MHRTKSVRGRFHHTGTDELAFEAQVRITYSQNDDDLPTIRAEAIIDDWKPEVEGQQYILRLSDEAEGEVMLYSVSPLQSRGGFRTSVKIGLQGSRWQSPDWFDKLEDG